MEQNKTPEFVSPVPESDGNKSTPELLAGDSQEQEIINAVTLPDDNQETP